MRFELTTLTLARLCSTPELRPHPWVAALLQIPQTRASRKPGCRGSPAGRSGEIRTHDPCLPKTVLYQAELHSVSSDAVYIAGPGFPQARIIPACAIAGGEFSLAD
jgi:hypothetical protein